MSKRLSIEDFISRAKAAHQNDYDYSLVDYTNNASKVNIFCIKHSRVFSQSPNKHMAGQGCPLCRYEKASESLTKTRVQFIEDSVAVHGQKFKYDRVVYVNSRTSVKILCNKHNIEFEQKPPDHLSGKGCPICAKESIALHSKSLTLTTEEFINRAIMVHEFKYDYSSSYYEKSTAKIRIWCNRHKGYFEQTANSHLAGVGCASCAKTGYSTNKPGTLYILTCGDMTKIGITNISASDRAKSISKSYGAEFAIKHLWEFKDGADADIIETNILRILRREYKQPTARFQGSSECFINVDYKYLLELIAQETSKILTNEK